MQCSFCNLSYHNSSECLGKAGGALVPKRHVEKEDYEWSCPRCWGPAVAKACRLAEPKPKSKVLGKKVVKKSGKTKPPKNTKKRQKTPKIVARTPRRYISAPLAVRAHETARCSFPASFKLHSFLLVEALRVHYNLRCCFLMTKKNASLIKPCYLRLHLWLTTPQPLSALSGNVTS